MGKINWKEWGTDILVDLFAGMIIAIGIYNFALNANFPVAGFSGIAIIMYHLIGLPVGAGTILLNVPVAIFLSLIHIYPAKRTLGDYGEPEKKRTALSFDQQKNLLNYVKNSEVFHIYLPLLQVMIGTGLRCGELIGLTWKEMCIRDRFRLCRPEKEPFINDQEYRIGILSLYLFIGAVITCHFQVKK